jgi:signal transduction histidine kinase
MVQRAHVKRRPEVSAVPGGFASRPEAATADARRDFLRMVSHELRTPLNSIIGFSEILSRELYGPLGAAQYREYAGIIQSSGLRLLRLVNQVLELAKLEAAGGELELGAESLEAVFEDAAHAVAQELAERRLELKVHLPAPAPSALADARAIRTAVVNLLQNAAAFAPEGGEVRLIGRVQGPLVQVEVADDGPGMDPERVAGMLNPFAHAEGSLTRRDGAGFGWVIVQALCQAMGGRFEVATAPGQGLSAVLSFRRAR